MILRTELISPITEKFLLRTTFSSFLLWRLLFSFTGGKCFVCACSLTVKGIFWLCEQNSNQIHSAQWRRRLAFLFLLRETFPQINPNHDTARQFITSLVVWLYFIHALVCFPLCLNILWMRCALEKQQQIFTTGKNFLMPSTRSSWKIKSKPPTHTHIPQDDVTLDGKASEIVHESFQITSFSATCTASLVLLHVFPYSSCITAAKKKLFEWFLKYK